MLVNFLRLLFIVVVKIKIQGWLILESNIVISMILELLGNSVVLRKLLVNNEKSDNVLFIVSEYLWCLCLLYGLFEYWNWYF